MKTVRDSLNNAEMTRILDALKTTGGKYGSRNHAIAALMLSTGFRVAEALALNFSDVFDFDAGLIRSEIYVRAETTKGKKARYVPLNLKARTAVAEAIKAALINRAPFVEDQPLFTSRKGRLCPRAFQLILREARIAAGLDMNVTSHCFRHTFITRIIQATKDIQLASELAGHSSVAVTQRYIHRSRSEMTAAVDKI